MSDNWEFEEARKRMIGHFNSAFEEGNEEAMDEILEIIQLYDSAFEKLTADQMQLVLLHYRGAEFDGDEMGRPADD